ncbi:Phosphotriesterase-related protein [Blattella germanica]|nr:Phosphotriesterase-related protein [Blattella germanica]
MVSKIQTVLGPISPEDLGRTLTHGHLPFGYDKFYIEPPKKFKEFLENKIGIDNIGFIRQFPYSNRHNIQFNDDDSQSAVLYDLELYKEFGGGAIVENTSHGLQRNVQYMKEVSQKTGIHVIAGTGYYLASVQPPSILAQSQETMYNMMLTELTARCVEQHDVKCGFIGEVASGWPLHEFEKRAIQAAGEVQEEVRCPVSFHSGRHPDAPFEIIRLFQESGGDAKKAVMSHIERTLYEDEEILEFSSLGSYCQFDLFGNECSYYQVNPAADMPSDAQRIDKIMCLLYEGKEDKILLAHDIHTKHRLIKFGGHGYSHILNNVLLKMLMRVHYDLMLFKQFGGGAIVENSNHGLERDAKFLKEVSQKTGIHVIAGTGHYISLVQPPSVLSQSKEAMYDLIMTELTTGCVDQPDVKCGFIGEVGSGWPLHEFEKRAIIATGEVQAQLGCPVSFHPGRHPEAPFEIIRLYQEAGGDARKAVMSHLDRTLIKPEDVLEFSNLGCYCQFDLFGTECSLYQLNLSVDMLSDAQRMDKIMCLVDAGKEDRILIIHQGKLSLKQDHPYL